MDSALIQILSALGGIIITIIILYGIKETVIKNGGKSNKRINYLK